MASIGLGVNTITIAQQLICSQMHAVLQRRLLKLLKNKANNDNLFNEILDTMNDIAVKLSDELNHTHNLGNRQ